ncbi:MAG TPA: MATE family efflux transporter [Gemmatimonadaceae bacterium]|nr:MATE family efflux transporter [Gemmatimonadaceae bacterium]
MPDPALTQERGPFSLQAELRSLLRLAVPVTLVQVGMMLMGVVDTIMVGRVSAAAIGAVALGNMYFFAATIFGMGVLLALDPIVSQAVGAKDDRAIARGMQRGLVLAAALAVLASVLLLPGEPLFGALRQPADVVPLAAGYAIASIAGVFPFYAFIVFRQTLQAMGRLRPIIATIVVANLANVLLNWVFVFGKFGVPAMGAVGTGWASSVSRLLMASLLLALAWRSVHPYLTPVRRDSFTVAPIWRMLRLGAPIGVQFQLEFGAFGIVAVFMGWFGTTQMAGHQVALNLASFTFMVPLGVSAAATVLVGQAVGRGDAGAARRAAATALACGVGFMVLSAIVLLSAPELLARVYTTEREVIAFAAVLIPLAGIFQVFDGTQVVAIGVLRGIGDTRSPMLINILGFWLIGMPTSLWLAFRTDLGPRGLWWGLVVGLVVVALVLVARVRWRMAGELLRLVIDESTDEHITETDRVVAEA